MKSCEFTESLYKKAVLLQRLAGHSLQLGGVRQSYTNGTDTDTSCPSIFSLRNGSAGIDVGQAISYPNDDIWDAGTVPVGCCEHLCPHGFDGVSCVGASETVGDVVHGSKDLCLRCIRVKLEVDIVHCAVDDDAHTDPSTVYVSGGEETLNEILHKLEVCLCHTGGRVQTKHQVGLCLVTACKAKERKYDMHPI